MFGGPGLRDVAEDGELERELVLVGFDELVDAVGIGRQARTRRDFSEMRRVRMRRSASTSLSPKISARRPDVARRMRSICQSRSWAMTYPVAR
jgi:hypothetical protein